MVKISTYAYPVIYVYRIDDERHKGMLKVGMTSIEAESVDLLDADCEVLRKKAIQRINQQTGTASIDYELLYAELAVFKENGTQYEFKDYDVREVLANSGYANAGLRNNNGAVASEWVKVNDVGIVKKAIAAVKERRLSLNPDDFKKPEASSSVVIKFRDEQSKAIGDTLARFTTGDKMLWNAKMRFGKTLCALEVIKRKQYRRTLIITHRPAVRSGWFEDFILLGFGNDYYFGSKKVKIKRLPAEATEEQKKINNLIDTKVKKFASLEEYAERGELRYIYFASIQDLRGSWDKTGEYKKNKEIFEADWDLLVVDEAHEGTKTEKGESVIAELQKHTQMRTLYLSGTPYNILDHFNPEEIYSWTYEMEQEAKQRWCDEHPDEPNPYEDLPRLELHTYSIDNVFDYKRDEDTDFFNFAEFFSVNKDTHTFVHKDDVKAFLDLLCKDSHDSNYPYSTKEYRFSLSHTLWVLPGVAEAAALSKLIKEHPTLKQYYVINIAGEGDDDQDNSDSVRLVKESIASHEKTITLTCGRMTTGVSVPEWSAVFMLCGGANISAAFYLQTIFRAQTPTRRGVFPKKKVCYAFDFAPDRAIEVISEYVDQRQRTSRQQTTSREKAIETTLRFLPVIAYEGSQEKQYDTISFMKDVGKAYKEHIKRRGFRDRRLFVNLATLSDEQYRTIGELGVKMTQSGHTFGAGNTDGGTDGIVRLANTGLDDNKPGKQSQKKDKEKNKSPKDAIPSGKKKPVDKSKEAFKVLGDILIRLPMLIFGCDLKGADITLQRILDTVDDDSWKIFMPKGVGKAEMQILIDEKLIIGDRFTAAASDIPKEVEAADALPITERVKAIAEMIARFRFPDKETVLTPWRVVNMHLSDTVGGYDFFDESHNKELSEPCLVRHNGVTDKVFKANARILEINSKSGLYPLYMAYSLYRKRISLPPTDMFAPSVDTEEGKQYVWDQVLRENLYVLCMSKMAAKITHRVLAGYRNVKTNTRAYLENRDLITDIKNKNELPNVVARIKGKDNFWGNNKTNMNFDAIVGNPPYQTGVNREPLYHLFIDLGRNLSKIGTTIHPARFLFNAGKTPHTWNEKMLHDAHYKVVKYWSNPEEVFNSVDIKGGVAITMWNEYENYGEIGFLIKQLEIRGIKEKVDTAVKNASGSFADLVYPRDLYKLTETLYAENEWAKSRPSKGHKHDLGTNAFDLFPELFIDDCGNSDDYALIIGRSNNMRIAKYIKKSYVKLPDNFDHWKVFVAKANGSGKLGEELANPFVAGPGSGSTTTFLSVGKFESEAEANACLSYIKTRFARLMLGILKVTQDNTRDAWAFVPLQDFSHNSPIDWAKSIAEIDEQLFAYYGLTEAEQAFIKSTIKEMN